MFILLQVFILVIFDVYSGISTAGFIGLMACLLSSKRFDMKAKCEMVQLEVFTSHMEYLRSFSCTRLLQPNLQYECKLQRTLVVFSECKLRLISECTEGGV
jgi:hypothetical protein